MSSGGGSSPTQTVTNVQSLAPELAPYAQQGLAQISALTNINQNPYQSYGGQQVAGFNPLQQQAFSNIQGMTPASQLGQATGMAGMAGMNALDPNAYAQNMQGYMSPYTKNVIEQQSQAAIRDYGRQLPQLGSMASQVGGLGGTRSALLQSEANRNLQNQLGNIEATGYQNAYQNAQNQFNQSQQQALMAAQGLGSLGGQQYQQEAGINQALMGAGTGMQNLYQRQLDANYQNFQNQQNYPYKNLAFLMEMIRGTPTTSSAQQVYQAPPNMAGQVAGLGLGLGSLFGGIGNMTGGGGNG